MIAFMPRLYPFYSNLAIVASNLEPSLSERSPTTSKLQIPASASFQIILTHLAAVGSPLYIFPILYFLFVARSA
jgi:hypothetical protein